jgi:hypothetical protein
MLSLKIIAGTCALALTAACGGTQAVPREPSQPSPQETVAATPPAPAPASTTAVPSTTPAPAVAPADPTPKLSPPISEAAVAEATGGKPESTDGVVKVSFPRTDVPVQVDAWKMPPFMGLTSWAAFAPGKAGVEAMVMGDLVLFEDEVNPVLSTLLDNGVQVTALHNHFFFDKPHVYFMHIGGEGSLAGLGKGVKLAQEKIKDIRKKSAQPGDHFGAALPAKSAIDGAPIDAAFGLKGTAKDGMYKVTMGRETTASCGCKVGKALGVNTWAAFAGTNDNAVVDGDFAVTEGELQAVLKALRAGGINIVAIHSHMTGESPRILFLHYWGRGKASELASTVRKALDLTAWDGKAKTVI